MAKTLKIWGGRTIRNCKQVRTLVAAQTVSFAAELVEESYQHFSDYWSETGNAKEHSIANETGVGVWVYDGDEYHPDTKIIRIK